jgi:hypothetical protein
MRRGAGVTGRLSILGAVLATMMMPAIAKLGMQTLSAPFVFITWLMLGLGWIEDNWFDVDAALASEPLPATKSARATKPIAAASTAHGHLGDCTPLGSAGGCVALLIYEKAVRFVEPE